MFRRAKAMLRTDGSRGGFAMIAASTRSSTRSFQTVPELPKAIFTLIPGWRCRMRATSSRATCGASAASAMLPPSRLRGAHELQHFLFDGEHTSGHYKECLSGFRERDLASVAPEQRYGARCLQRLYLECHGRLRDAQSACRFREARFPSDRVERTPLAVSHGLARCKFSISNTIKQLEKYKFE